MVPVIQFVKKIYESIMCVSVNLHIVCHLAENYRIKPFVTIKYAWIESYVIFCDIKQNYFSFSSTPSPTHQV